MASSGSTPNPPPDPPIPLLLVIAGEDHPKACTGRKLRRAGLVRILPASQRPKGGPLLLDPYAARPLSAEDRPIARRGLVGIDCSWNRLGDRGRYPLEIRWIDRIAERRRLPWLLAANPQHFGRLGELNTAEAFASALWVLGERERAHSLLERFPGGGAFFEVNGPTLARYAGCVTEREIREAERLAFSGEAHR